MTKDTRSVDASGATPVGVTGRPRVPGDMVEISLVALANVLLRRRRIVIGTPVVLVALTVALVAAFVEREYTATSRFMPNGEARDVSQLSGIAAQLGLVLPTSTPGQSLGFYAALLQTRQILRDAVTTVYRAERPGQPGDTIEATLVEWFGIEAATPAEAANAAIGELSKRVAVTIEAPSGLVVLEATAPTPDLAVQVNRRLLDLVNEFNLERRQTQARAEREFVESRLEEARRELAEAEAELKEFLERNRRGVESAPHLRFEWARLDRQVALRQEIVTQLSKAFEQARIVEVRNTPVLTLVDGPEGSIRAARRNMKLAVAMALFLGGTLGIALAFFGEHIDRQRTMHPEVYGELRQLGREAIRDLDPRRWLSRWRGWRGSRASAAGAPARKASTREDVVERV
ncbi:MAG TPA: Wzz/FepE/Etk N-terminal domain-containing protein [Longimicrobiales bacterium]